MDNMENAFKKIAKRYAEVKVEYLQDERKYAEICLKWAEDQRDQAKKYGILEPGNTLSYDLHGLDSWLNTYRGHLNGITETASLLPDELFKVLWRMMNKTADKEALHCLGNSVMDYEKETNHLLEIADNVLNEAHALEEKWRENF